MTILSKDAASSSGPSSQKGADLKSANSHLEPDSGVLGSPPSYEDSQAAGPSTTETRELPRPANFMSINRNYGSIKDTWVIDTNIRIPEGLLPPLGIFSSLRPRPNLSLYTASGDIKAAVILASSSSSRATIKADTAYGKVAIQISRINSKQPFKLSASTKYGDVVIGLPRDYVGPLKYKIGWGKTTFSPSLNTNVVQITGESAFVGDIGDSGFVNYRTWPKDEVNIEASYGNVSFVYVDEMPANSSSFEQRVEGAVKTALGWLGLR